LTTAPVSDELVGRISDLVRDTQALAVEQAWPLDWPELARVRREAEDTRSDGRLRSSLRQLGEAVVLLGEGGRVYRKEHGIL
jgi:protein phosphatase